MERPPTQHVRIAVIPMMRGIEIGVALIAFVAWLAMREIAPLLIGVAVLVSGPAAPHLQRVSEMLVARWGGADLARHCPRLVALICLMWAALS